MSEVKMVVGLGNPGKKYLKTRHNIGFTVIDSLAESLNIDVNKRKFGARLGLGRFADVKLILAKPWQFMNLSGLPVASVLGFYRLSIGQLLVIADDLAIEPGRIRLRAKGSAGGHNGLADIIDKLGTDEFARCRIGIGRTVEDAACQTQVDYVLDMPTQAQKTLLADAIERARDAVLCWIENGIDKAMNEFNI